MTGCEHRFVFLREDSQRQDGSFRPETDFYDVFFCEMCLEYRRVRVAETVSYGDGRTERRGLIR